MPDSHPKPIPPESAGRQPAGRTFPCTTVSGPGGRRQEVLILYATEDLNHKVRVLCSTNFMRVFIHYVRTQVPHEVTLEELDSYLEEAGVVEGVDADALKMLTDLLNAPDKTAGPFQVARGTPPRRGEDGHIEFLVKPVTDEAQYDTDLAGNMDYRETNLIQNAVKGQQIATIHPPREGTPGRDVLGRALATTDGKPVSLRLGKNVAADDDMVNIFADADGCPVFDRHVLSVNTHYEVIGNVDYSVGNIDFIGTVEIKGSILDDFDVTARRGLKVHGNCGCCMLRSDGDIEILGGIAGRSEGRVVCGGQLQAKYLNDVHVESHGDVIVRREIVNSTIRTNGAVRIKDGAIVGGDVLAFRGIEANVIGSDLGVATRVATGLDWRTEDKIAALDVKIAETSASIERIKESLDPMLGDKTRLLELTDAQRGILQELIAELRQMREKVARSHEERSTLVDKTPKGRVSQINVQSMVHQGTLIRFSHLRAHVKQSYRGPLSVVQDLERDTVRLLSGFGLAADDAPERPWLGSVRDLGRL